MSTSTRTWWRIVATLHTNEDDIEAVLPQIADVLLGDPGLPRKNWVLSARPEDGLALFEEDEEIARMESQIHRARREEEAAEEALDDEDPNPDP